jgi:hypothetical protein
MYNFARVLQISDAKAYKLTSKTNWQKRPAKYVHKHRQRYCITCLPGTLILSYPLILQPKYSRQWRVEAQAVR